MNDKDCQKYIPVFIMPKILIFSPSGKSFG